MNYKEVIESKYNREAWQKLLYDIFRNKISFWNTPSAVHVSSRLAKEALNLGKISLVQYFVKFHAASAANPNISFTIS